MSSDQPLPAATLPFFSVLQLMSDGHSWNNKKGKNKTKQTNKEKEK